MDSWSLPHKGQRTSGQSCHRRKFYESNRDGHVSIGIQNPNQDCNLQKDQTIIFHLRSGHNRLKKHMHTKFKIGTSPKCPCGNIAQTAEHILHDRPLHAELRQQTWPKPSTLDDKLNGTEYNLTQTVEFIEVTGLQIRQDANSIGTQKKKEEEEPSCQCNNYNYKRYPRFATYALPIPYDH